MSDDLEWEIKVRDKEERVAPGKYEVVVRQGGLAGWSIHKTEAGARAKALARLRYFQASKDTHRICILKERDHGAESEPVGL